MKTTRKEQATRVIFGLGLIVVGSFALFEVMVAGYLIGLLLIGIGLVPRSTEYPEDYPKAAKAEPADLPSEAAAPRKKAARRKKAPKKA